MRPDVVHPGMLRELIEVLTELLFIIYRRFWQTGKVPVDWRLVNVMPIYKKGQKEDPGDNRSLSLAGLGFQELIPFELFKEYHKI